MALKISAQIEGSPGANRKPGIWDPLVGMTYERHLGRKWRIDAHMDGGGFGVGSDVTVAGSFLAEWQFARHFGMNFGFGALHFRVTNTVDNDTVKVDQTMYGPIFGFGIFF